MPQKTFSEPIKYCVLNEIPYIVVLQFSVWLGLIKDIDFNRTQTCTCKLLVLQKSIALQNRFQYEAQVESIFRGQKYFKCTPITKSLALI